MTNKLLLDVNVILDVALARKPHIEASQKILSYIEERKATGYMSAISCGILYYLVGKETNHKRAVAFIRDLMTLLSVVEVNRNVLERALQIELDDFEDSIQVACAEHCKADYFVTRDIAMYKKSTFPTITPAEYLATYV